MHRVLVRDLVDGRSRFNHIVDWAHDRFGPSGMHECQRWRHRLEADNRFDLMIVFEFRDLADALIMKLTWGGQ